jgi:type II secretory pathway component PulM
MGYVVFSASTVLIAFGILVGVALLILLPLAARWERAAHKDTEIRELRAQLREARTYAAEAVAIADEIATTAMQLTDRK